MDRRRFIAAATGRAALALGMSATGPAMANPSEFWRQRAVELPPAFERYDKIGGVLLFAPFADVEGDEDSAAAAICSVVPDTNPTILRALGSRRIDDKTFFGDWCDAKSGDLLRVGEWRTLDGRTLINPRLRDLDNVEISGGGFEVSEPGAGGQFAYAFSETPYGLQGAPGEVQALFERVVEFLLPPNAVHEIRDWTSPRLPEASPFFEAGMEWWGVFLFTIYVPSLRRLTVIAGSTTD